MKIQLHTICFSLCYSMNYCLLLRHFLILLLHTELFFILSLSSLCHSCSVHGYFHSPSWFSIVIPCSLLSPFNVLHMVKSCTQPQLFHAIQRYNIHTLFLDLRDFAKQKNPKGSHITVLVFVTYLFFDLLNHCPNPINGRSLFFMESLI